MRDDTGNTRETKTQATQKDSQKEKKNNAQDTDPDSLVLKYLGTVLDL